MLLIVVFRVGCYLNPDVGVEYWSTYFDNGYKADCYCEEDMQKIVDNTDESTATSLLFILSFLDHFFLRLFRLFGLL